MVVKIQEASLLYYDGSMHVRYVRKKIPSMAKHVTWVARGFRKSNSPLTRYNSGSHKLNRLMTWIERKRWEQALPSYVIVLESDASWLLHTMNFTPDQPTEQY